MPGSVAQAAGAALGAALLGSDGGGGGDLVSAAAVYGGPARVLLQQNVTAATPIMDISVGGVLDEQMTELCEWVVGEARRGVGRHPQGWGAPLRCFWPLRLPSACCHLCCTTRCHRLRACKATHTPCAAARWLGSHQPFP